MSSAEPRKIILAENIRLRHPRAADGVKVHALIERCKPLDPNSLYCNLLQCTHFAGTCAVAERDGKLVGFVSGFVEPDDPESLFVWQVAVAPEARGCGLGERMIAFVLDSPACARVRKVHATIGEDNAASWGMFGKLAHRLGTTTSRRMFFDKDTCFAGKHESEILITVGPFDRTAQFKNAS